MRESIKSNRSGFVFGLIVFFIVVAIPVLIIFDAFKMASRPHLFNRGDCVTVKTIYINAVIRDYFLECQPPKYLLDYIDREGVIRSKWMYEYQLIKIKCE